MLGVVAVKVHSARQAVSLLRGENAPGLTVLTARKIEISADAAQIPAGIDGEAVSMSTPVACTISPMRSASGCRETGRASPLRSRP